MYLEITKELFDFHLPSFKEPNGKTYKKMESYLEAAGEEVQEIIGRPAKDLEEQFEATDAARRLICLLAAHTAVPQLDLVSTPNGFGIVSTEQVVPASRERVLRLEENLRQEVSKARTVLLFILRKWETWAQSNKCSQYISSLLWSPQILGRYGVTLEGKPLFDEEYNRLKVRLSAAEEQLKSVISPELYDVLLSMVRHREAERDIAYDVVLERSRKYVAALLDEEHPRSAAALLQSLQGYLTENTDILTEYNTSSTHTYHGDEYENQKGDASFFF